MHPRGVQGLEVSLRKQRFGLPVRVRPREACQEHRHLWSPCHLPLATYFSYPCSDSVRANLNEVVSSLPPATPAVVQVSDQVFAVFGLPTASNPLGFCHVKREDRNKSGYSCTAKDCRSFSSKAKGSTAKAFCLHPHLLFASLEQFSPAEQAGPSSSSSSSSASQSEPVVSFDSKDVEDLITELFIT